MTLHILKCTECGTYTLKSSCPACSSASISPKPARYSPEDRWGEWRRKAKKEKGWL